MREHHGIGAVSYACWLQGIMEVFMREPLLDWQREAQTLKAKRSEPRSGQDATSAAELPESEDMSHVNLKVRQACALAASQSTYRCL